MQLWLTSRWSGRLRAERSCAAQRHVGQRIEATAVTEALILRIKEILRSGKHRDRGLSEFAVLPARGDRVVLAAVNGDLDILEVIYLEHQPVELPRDKKLDLNRTAEVTVFVELREVFTG